jgi:integrase
MPTLRLTRAAIERIKAPTASRKQVPYWDTELRGFGVLASGTSAAKSYIVQRRLPDGRTRRLTLGAVGEFAKVEDARRKAGALLAGLREGKDPKAERRKAAVRDRTLREALELYLKANKELRPRSIKEYRGSTTRHLESWLDRPLRELTRDMIEKKHAAIGEAAGPAAANNAMRALRAIWNDALDRDGTLPANPTRALRRNRWFKLEPRTRMVRTDELPAFFAALEELPNRTAADYLRFLLFTGCRRSEAAGLRWEEVDFVSRVIRLPAIRAKGGRKLDLPMSSFVRDLLVKRRAIGNDGGFVFGADSRSGHIEEPKFALAMVAKTTGVTVSAHDLRRTFVTVAEGCDISPFVLKALVNHALGSDVTSGYVQMTAERLREPAQRVCDRMMKLCRIETPEPKNVARIGDRA